MMQIQIDSCHVCPAFRSTWSTNGNCRIFSECNCGKTIKQAYNPPPAWCPLRARELEERLQHLRKPTCGECNEAGKVWSHNDPVKGGWGVMIPCDCQQEE